MTDLKHLEQRLTKIKQALESRDYRLAEQRARNALKVFPDHALAHYVLGMALLHQGRLGEGLTENEWRLEHYGSWSRNTGLPLWGGESDAHLFVSYEQGIADELQWLPLLHDLLPHARSLLVEADDRLLPILRRTFGSDIDYIAAPKTSDKSVVYAGHWRVIDAGCTHVVPLGSLPFHLIKSRKDFNNFVPLKHKEPTDQMDRCRTYGRSNDLHVGLCWRSRASREGLYTQLEWWRDLFEVPNVTIWNLQYDQEDLDIVRAGLPIGQVAGMDTFNGIDDMGAFMSLLDVVIAPSGAVSKLAGALGFPVHMLLPGPDHIQFGDVDFPLLPSVTCWTAKDGDWNRIIKEIVSTVERQAKEKTR